MKFHSPKRKNTSIKKKGQYKKNLSFLNYRDFIVNCQFVCSEIPWFVRGGNHNRGTGTGVFTLERTYGSALLYESFRVSNTMNQNIIRK